ncbi:MAG: SH3 domain-containing protein, partial [Blautia sp.]|nr:SH3 domain-containing protein [Blautia sp.]
MKRWKKWSAAFLAACFTAVTALGEVPTMPEVTTEMTDPFFWMRDLADTRQVLATEEEIQAFNQSFIDTPDCCMTDFRGASRYFHEKALYRAIWRSEYNDASSVLSMYHYDIDGEEVSGNMVYEALGNIGGEDAKELAKTRFGIAVHRSDVIALPSLLLATDEKGDADYNFYQLSSVRVNEPVVVKATSKDGKFYYCDTDCCSGWIASEDIAICEDKAEWLEAWDFPSSEAIVINEGKFYMEASNTNPDVSELLLTMGTVLRRVPEEDFDHDVIMRMPYYNYAVYIPVRKADGSYDKTIALISMNHFVSEGYLPLTTENILKVAFSKLGERYGWGNMLKASDCSGYMRDVYRCFGLILPRNTTWQQAMPVRKIDVSEATVEEKQEALRTMPPGAILYFNGHEMMYLGHVEDKFYVLSCLSNIRSFEGEESVKVASVAINSLDVHRMNGMTWMEALTTLLVPYEKEVVVEETQETEEAAEGTEGIEVAAEGTEETPEETEGTPEGTEEAEEGAKEAEEGEIIDDTLAPEEEAAAEEDIESLDGAEMTGDAQVLEEKSIEEMEEAAAE